MFQIKICGVRLEEDLLAVERSGADAVGLNFFPPSVRFLDPAEEKTHELAASARRHALKTVGVFVNESPNGCGAVATRLNLDAIQLHGDETLEVADRLIKNGHRVIRAIKLPRGPLDPDRLEAAARPWARLGCHLLLDVDAGSSHGGSGKTLDWGSLRGWARSTGYEWTLAGGLKPENVGEAVTASGAVSVDTASGVECPRGVKSAERIGRFADSFRSAIGDEG